MYSDHVISQGNKGRKRWVGEWWGQQSLKKRGLLLKYEGGRGGGLVPSADYVLTNILLSHIFTCFGPYYHFSSLKSLHSNLVTAIRKCNLACEP